MEHPSALLAGVMVGLATASAAAALFFAHRRTAEERREKRAESTNDDSPNTDEPTHVLNLLYNIAAHQAQTDGYIHRSITCSSCRMSPLRGIRYKCLNCADYDLCSTCEAQDCHHLGHVFAQIKIPLPPLLNPRGPMLRTLYPGRVPPSSLPPLAWETIAQLQASTHFDHVELKALYDQYCCLTTSPSGLDPPSFAVCVGGAGRAPNLIVDRLFAFFDQDGDGHIGFADAARGLSILCKGSYTERIEHVFRGYDRFSRGYITREDVRDVLQALCAVNGELLKDVMGSLERDMISSFNEASVNPVSAAFQAPLPPQGSARGEGDSSGMADAMVDLAIEELVETVFRNGEGRMSLVEFKAVAATEPALCAWLDSLGSVF